MFVGIMLFHSLVGDSLISKQLFFLTSEIFFRVLLSCSSPISPVNEIFFFLYFLLFSGHVSFVMLLAQYLGFLGSDAKVRVGTGGGRDFLPREWVAPPPPVLIVFCPLDD